MNSYIRSSDLLKCDLHTAEGEAGRVHDIYFDDQHWIIRYLVVSAGKWLARNKVLVTPNVVQDIDLERKRIHISLTKETLENSPYFDSEQTVSRHYEAEYFKYFGWSPYWEGDPYLSSVIPPQPYQTPEDRLEPSKPENPHLRGVDKVEGYHVKSSDGEIGHVSDFLIDTNSWVIKLLEINTRNWLPGKQVLIMPTCVESVDWAKAQITVSVAKQLIENAPQIKELEFLGEKEEEIIKNYYYDAG